MPVWNQYHRFRVSPQVTSEIRHAGVVQLLEQLQSLRPEAMTISELGVSFEGRRIQMVSLGTGPKKVLAWSQMHGDEPTHTAALLDLIGFLQTSPDVPLAETVLSNCTLHLILMLNPDGAERYTRRNAQGIDINRDALALQSPEGRLLEQTVREIQPHFAFNLHNQSPRKSVGSNPARVAAVSLLVPPIDAADSQTEQIEVAKQLAACFKRSVESHCPEMISRYDADFMPRCFGEWVQQQGIATLTVEAGGWTTPSIESSPLVRIHLFGLTTVLEAISNDTYLHADPQQYDALPRSNGHDLFDLVVRNARLLGNGYHEPHRCDVGVNFQLNSSIHTEHARGTVVDIGDLSVTTGKIIIDGSDSLCLPGKCSFLHDLTPDSLPGNGRVNDLLREGVTSLIGTVDLSSHEALRALQELSHCMPLPVNVGFLAHLPEFLEKDVVELQQLLAFAVSLDLLGFIGGAVPEHTSRLLQSLNLYCLSQDTLAGANHSLVPPSNGASHVANPAELLRLPELGNIAIGRGADFVCLQADSQTYPHEALDWGGLQRVVVAGNVVWEGGSTLMDRGGRLLTNRFTK